MSQMIFKGFKTKNGMVEGFNPSTLENGFIYLIRTDENKKDGYIYFNGKSYGTASDVRETVESLLKVIGSNEIKGENGEVISGATGLYKYIEESISNSDAVAEGSDANAKVNTLIGEDTGKTVRDIVADELAKQLIADDADDSLKSLQEIAAWIQSHPADVASMNAKIEGKADAEHTHEIANVNSLQDALDAKISTGSTLSIEMTPDSGETEDNGVAFGTFHATLADGEFSASTGEINYSYINDMNKFKESIVGKEAQEGDDENPAVEATGLYKKIDTLESKIQAAAGDVPVYEAGLGVDFVSGDATTVKAKVAEVEGKKNYLTVDENGLAVSDEDFSKIKTTKDITIAGLEGTLGAGLNNGDPIPAGTSLQEFLEKLLVKELFAEKVGVTTGGTTSVSAPAVRLSKSGNVEVGTFVSVNAITANRTNLSRTAKVSGMTYGYADDAEGTNYTSDTTYTFSVPAAVIEGEPSLVMSFTKFGKGSETITGTTSIEAQSDLVVEAGQNSVKISETGATATIEAVPSKTFYLATNLKNYYTKDNKDEDNTYVANPFPNGVTASPVGTGSTSVNGCYKYFVGCSDKTKFTSDEVRGFATHNGMFTSSTVTLVSATSKKYTDLRGAVKYLVVALPTGYSIKSVDNSLGVDMKPSFKKVSETEVECGDAKVIVKYDIYAYENNAQPELKNFVIGK